MKSLKLIILLLLISEICISQEGNSIIYWNKNYKLKCLDFKGEAKDTSKNIVAISYLEIRCKGFWSNNIPNYNIFAIFHPSISWLTDTTCLILAHEQLNFDMTELFARKLRKHIAELRQNLDSDIDKYSYIIKNINNEYEMAINKYDEETFHGESVSKQEEWNEKIAKDLEELKDYEVKSIEYLNK